MVRSKNPFWGIFIPLQNDLLLRTHGPRCPGPQPPADPFSAATQSAGRV